MSKEVEAIVSVVDTTHADTMLHVMVTMSDSDPKGWVQFLQTDKHTEPTPDYGGRWGFSLENAVEMAHAILEYDIGRRLNEAVK